MKVSIIGAGLVGSLWAVYMSKRGHQVDVYELRPDMRKAKIGGGKSINLALSDRGWQALNKVGIDESIREIGIPMKGRFIHNEDGSSAFQPYGLADQAIWSVSRAKLNMVMMDEAEKRENINIHFNQKLVKLDQKRNHLLFYDANNDKNYEVNSDLIFGADGAFSRVRYGMQKSPRFDYCQTYLKHAYKELSIPPNADGTHKLEKNALHIWPRGHFMLIALPNMDGSFTCTLFAPFDGEDSFARIQKDADIIHYFEKYFPDALKLMPELIEDFHDNPTSALVTVKCFPWTDEKTCLMGDAAHAVVPFYGQGMNCGFEDCYVLNNLIDEHEGNWKSILKAYELARKENADAIADMAVANFIEMRDLVGHPEFLLRKKIEKHLNVSLGDDFLPMYSMVTFSHIPYAQALREGQRQDKLLRLLMERENIENEWNSAEITAFAKKWLQEN